MLSRCASNASQTTCACRASRLRFQRPIEIPVTPAIRTAKPTELSRTIVSAIGSPLHSPQVTKG